MLAGANRGYVLVSVLVLALVASMVVFVSIRENQLQERMSGNQQKMINARLAAERGIAAALDYITNQMASGTDINSIANGGGLLALRGTPDNYRLSDVAYVSADKRLSLLSTGHDSNNDATAQLNARFELKSSGSALAKGVVGCDDVKVKGGGFIDSYDSSKGGYNLNSNHGSNAFVAIVNGTASEDLNGVPNQMPAGFSLINGDFIAYNGRLTTKGQGSIVSGNVTANGGVILNGGTSVGGNVIAKDGTTLNGKSSIGGNVHAGGGFIANGGGSNAESSSVGGNVSAESVRLNGNASINGNVISNGELVTNGSNNVINGSASAATADLKGTINGSLNVGAGSIQTDNGNGKVLGGVNYNATNRPTNSQPSIPEPGVLAEYCKQILAQNTWLQEQLGPLPAGDNGELNNSAFSNMNNANNKAYSKLELTGNNNSDRRVIDVTQNTTLYVTGEIKMTNLTIKVSQGKSLTIKQITGGHGKVVDMNDVAIVSADGSPLGTANNGGVPPFSLYSDSTDQVNIRAENHEGSNSPIFSAVYAPLANINIQQGAGDFSGSLLGRIVSIQNPKGFHYDEALGNIGGGASSSSIKLTSILDHFPEQAVQSPEEEE